MPDMIVKLFDLPNISISKTLFDEGIDIRRALSPDKSTVLEFAGRNFNYRWVNECDAAFSNIPATCYIAVKNKTEVIGFACFEATYKCFFGPTGVSEDHRGKGIGKLLLLHSLYGLKEMGYAYGIIGGAGTKELMQFYSKVAGAILIEGSSPGIYKNMLGY